MRKGPLVPIHVAVWRWLNGLPADELRDLHAYGGVALVAVGCGWLEPATGLIAAGMGLIYLALRKA